MPAAAKPKPELLWSVWIFRARRRDGSYFIEWPFVHNDGASLIDALARAGELHPGQSYANGRLMPGTSVEIVADDLSHDDAMNLYHTLPHVREVGGDFGNWAIPPRRIRSVA